MRNAAAAVGWASLAFLGVGAMLLMGGRAAVGMALLALAFLLAPVALALAVTGRGALARQGILLLLTLCALGALIGVVAAFTGPGAEYVLRGLAALVASLCGWGLLLGARLLRSA